MSYVPRNVAAFCVWITNILLYVAKHHERWGISAPPDEFTEQATRLKELAEKCAKPEHTDMDIFNKNTLWKSAEKDARRYLQGMVMHNPNVTDEDRRMMGLPVRDTIRTPVGDPVGLPTAIVKYLNEGALELHIEHVDTTPYDKRANYGVKIAYDVFPMDASLPDNPEALHRSVFTRRKKELISFDSGDRRKMAVFCLRYENSKGRAPAGGGR